MGYKVPHITNLGSNTSSDGFNPVATGMQNYTSTEANVQQTWRTAGTFSNFTVNITTNVSGTGLGFFRVNGADGNQNISYTAGQLGDVTDAVNTDDVAAGDEVAYRMDKTGTNIITWYASYFEAEGNQAFVKATSVGPYSFTSASTTRYGPVAGGLNLQNAETGLVQHPILEPCTARNMYVYVSTNGRTTTTTVRSRVNGATGNQTVSYGSGIVGVKEDLTNTDVLSLNDTFDTQVTTSTGTGTTVFQLVSYEMKYPGSAVQMFASNTDGATNSGTTNVYLVPNGYQSNSGGESSPSVPFLGTGRVRNAEVWVMSNASGATENCTVRLNSASTALTIAVPPGQTGSFTDSTHSFTFTNGQTLNWLRSKSDASAVAIGRMTFVVEYTSAFVPKAMLI